MGDSYRIETPSCGKTEMHVIGVYRDPQLLQGTIVSQTLFNGISAARDPWIILADARADVAPEVAKRHVEAALQGFPAAAVESKAGYNESVITAVIGGLLGTGVGLLFAFLVTQSLDDLGLGFAPPLGQLVIFLRLAVAVGVIAAVVPARRGSRLQVVEALQAE